MTIKEFVRSKGITLTAEWTDSNPYMDSAARDMDHWKVRLKYGRKQLTTYFSMGFGHNGKAPTASDVLSCLASDADVEHYDFEEWCSNLGFDIDSRRAEKIYRVSQQQTRKLRTWLGAEAFESLIVAEQE